MAESVYVRVARIVLEEKQVPYDLTPVDPFADAGLPVDYRRRHPFGRIPAFEHGDFKLYETTAITRYVDEVFSGPSLQPATTRSRARMNQVIGIGDAYIYRAFVWGIYVERLEKPAAGLAADQDLVFAALVETETILNALTELLGGQACLAGPDVTLADLHLAPMFDFLLRTEEGRAAVDRYPAIKAWWLRVSARPSMKATDPLPLDPR